MVNSGPTPTAPPPPPHDHTHSPTLLLPPLHPSPTTTVPPGMQWSVWSGHGGHHLFPPPHHHPHFHHHHHHHHLSPIHHPHIPTSRSDPLALSTLQLHQVHIVHSILGRGIAYNRNPCQYLLLLITQTNSIRYVCTWLSVCYTSAHVLNELKTQKYVPNSLLHVQPISFHKLGFTLLYNT